MKWIRKRSLCIVLLSLFVLSFSTTAFASEIDNIDNTKCYNLEVTSEGISSITDENGDSVSPYSTISGYEQATLTNDPAGVQVFIDSSGWGGMGVTVKASSSWNGYMNLDILSPDGDIPAQGRSVYSNGETYLNNLFHYNPPYYLFSFRGIPSGQSVFVQIWVYG